MRLTSRWYASQIPPDPHARPDIWLAEHGYLTALIWLCRQGAPVDVHPHRAAELGHTDVVKWLHSQLGVRSDSALADAAKHLDLVQFYHEAGVPWEPRFMGFANPTTLAWALQHGYSINSRGVRQAVASDNLPVLEWCAEQKLLRSLNPNTWSAAHSIPMLEWLRNHQVRWDPNAIAVAVAIGDLPTTQWMYHYCSLITRSEPVITDRIIGTAVEHPELFRWLVNTLHLDSRPSELHDEACTFGVWNSTPEYLAWLWKRYGVRPLPEALGQAAQYLRQDLILYLRNSDPTYYQYDGTEISCVLGYVGTEMRLEGFSPAPVDISPREMARWLYEDGCRPNSRTLAQLAEIGDLESLRWLVEEKRMQLTRLTLAEAGMSCQYTTLVWIWERIPETEKRDGKGRLPWQDPDYFTFYGRYAVHGDATQTFRWLVEHGLTLDPRYLRVGIELNDLRLVRWLLDQGMGIDPKVFRSSLRQCIIPIQQELWRRSDRWMEIKGEMGNSTLTEQMHNTLTQCADIRLLRWAHAHRPLLWTTDCMSNISDMEVVRWMREHGCPWGSEMRINRIVDGVTRSDLVWMHAQGFRDPKFLDVRVDADTAQLITWALEIGFPNPWSPEKTRRNLIKSHRILRHQRIRCRHPAVDPVSVGFDLLEL